MNAASFRLVGPAAGRYRISTARIGYRPLVSGLGTLVVGDTTPVQLRLVELPLELDTVRTGDNEDRRAQLGHVMSREDLAKCEHDQPSDVLAHMPGVEIVRGGTGQAWVASTRGGEGMDVSTPLPGQPPRESKVSPKARREG